MGLVAYKASTVFAILFLWFTLAILDCLNRALQLERSIYSVSLFSLSLMTNINLTLTANFQQNICYYLIQSIYMEVEVTPSDGPQGPLFSHRNTGLVQKFFFVIVILFWSLTLLYSVYYWLCTQDHSCQAWETIWSTESRT